jgi:CHASE2 domain-containing sensor protein
MKIFKIDIFLSTVSVFVVIAILPFLFNIDFFDPIRTALQDINVTDVYFSKLLDKNESKEVDLVIVNTCEVSFIEGLKEINELEIIQTLERVNQSNPTTVGIDHIFYRDTTSPEYNIMADMYIKHVLSTTKNLVLSIEFKDYEENNNSFKKSRKTDQFYIENADVGFTNLTTNSNKNNSTIRNFSPNVFYKNKEYTHFAVKLASKFNPDAVERFSKRKFEKETINYRGNTSVYQIVDARDILDNTYDPEIFKNKIVLFGLVDTVSESDRIENLYFTPLNERNAGKTFPDMYSSVINSNIISMIIDDNFYNEMPMWGIFIISFILCYFNMMLFYNIAVTNPKWFELSSILLFTIESIGILYITFQFFIKYKYELKFTLTLIACALSVVIFEFYYSSIKPFVFLLLSKIWPDRFSQLVDSD